jgi:hypothetical protein
VRGGVIVRQTSFPPARKQPQCFVWYLACTYMHQHTKSIAVVFDADILV